MPFIARWPDKIEPGTVSESWIAARMGDWKLLHFFEDGHRELYNLADDIGETNDLIDHEPIIAVRLTLALQNWWRAVGAQFPIANEKIAL